MPDTTVSRRWLIVLLLAFTVVWFGSLGQRKLIKPDEGRYAEIAREMALDGDWVTPRLNGLRYFEKPPLQYWATAAAFDAFGEHDWAARLWPALTGWLGVLLAWYTGRRLFGACAGLLAAAALGSSLFYLVIGHFNTLDMGLSFFLQLALCAFLLAQREGATPREQRGWMLVAWSGAALAALSKGLVSLALPGATLLLYTLLTRDAAPWRRLYLLPGLALFVVIAAPWHVLAALHNPEFAHFYFIHEHFERFLTTTHGRVEPWWYFVPILAAAALPWTTLAMHACIAQWKAPGEAGRALRFLVVWSGFTLLFFSASGSKLPSYILPILPAFALLVGALLPHLSPRAMSWHAAGVAVLALLGLALAPSITRRADAETTLAMLQAYEHVLLAAALIWLGCALGAMWLARRVGVQPAALLLAAGSLVFGLLVLLGHENLSRSNSAYHIAREVRPLLAPDAPFYAVAYFEHTLPYYLQRTLTLVEYRDEMDFGLQQEPDRWVPTVAQFALRWRADPLAYAVMTERMYRTLAAQGLPMRVLARDTRRVIVAKPESASIQ